MSHLEQKDFNFHVSNVASLCSRECFLNTVIECSMANHKRRFFLPIFLLHLTMCKLCYSFSKNLLLFWILRDFLDFWFYRDNSNFKYKNNLQNMPKNTFKCKKKHFVLETMLLKWNVYSSTVRSKSFFGMEFIGYRRFNYKISMVPFEHKISRSLLSCEYRIVKT
jgi:hypothetical protein